jgi:hypothetical protein
VELVQATVHTQLLRLRDDSADLGLVRLDERPDDLSAIPLYTETSVVVVPRDHLLTAAEEVTAADLADETLLVPTDDSLRWADPPGDRSLLPAPATTEEAVDLVAAGVGVLVVPQSLARLHHRKDLTYRPVTDAPTSTVALAWVSDRTTGHVETFVGIVRGRTARSSRGKEADDGARSQDAGPPRDGRGGAGSGRTTGSPRSGGGSGTSSGGGSGHRSGTGGSGRGGTGRGRSTGRGDGRSGGGKGRGRRR